MVVLLPDREDPVQTRGKSNIELASVHSEKLLTLILTMSGGEMGRKGFCFSFGLRSTVSATFGLLAPYT